ncbi:hypothetical protein SS1G_14266 [Sclerotinia sclerotiorum 1980 UF-70]|uniref:Uncharacterized protein n=1 Tax=Sclerotinia sclerotiorum (strain ATCC 18683 / 1980 / Ss-1) TaxID=665079 RepID=A7F9I5_SCLS1|nr:hypothetical protein SS1G_14266 [Sclerotinia sclerotiorum 1980 UF-70]EDO00396.1 hypothetical protein SS1G_14266 [Sclerotinia sclerotiorum 1980 UF-70]
MAAMLGQGGYTSSEKVLEAKEKRLAKHFGGYEIRY